MKCRLLGVQERWREMVFRFEVKHAGRFRLAIPKKYLADSENVVYAKTIIGGIYSYKILIRWMWELEIIESYPSLEGIHPVWILRHEASSLQSDC